MNKKCGFGVFAHNEHRYFIVGSFALELHFGGKNAIVKEN